MALAYFITFSTYGTWLHGTAKEEGSVDRRHNVYGTPFVSADELHEARAESRMSQIKGHPIYWDHLISFRTAKSSLRSGGLKLAGVPVTPA